MKFLPKVVKSKLRLVRFLKNKLNVAKKSRHVHVVKFISKSMISSKSNACEMQNLQGTWKFPCILQRNICLGKVPQDEITCFRISETWRKHAIPWFRYIYVSRKRENSSATLFRHVSGTEMPSHVSTIFKLADFLFFCFHRVSANGFAVVCYIYTKTQTRDGSLNNNES